MQEVKTQVEKIAEPKLEEMNCFLVEVKILPHNKVQVFIDSDKGVTINECTQVSRYIENYLDEETLLGEKYTLEVSSPGVGQPLRLVRQYKKNIGRQVEVTYEEGEKKKGKLLAADEDRIIIEEPLRVKVKGRYKNKGTKETQIPFNKIKETKVLITF